MVTIPLKVSDELAQRLMPLQDRLPDIIEHGLRDLEAETGVQSATASKAAVLEALQATGIVTVPDPAARLKKRTRHTPLQAGGQPASEMIVEERGAQ